MKKILGFLAVAGLAFIAMPSHQANALSLANPAGVASAQHASENATTEVRWRRGGWGRHRGWHRRGWRRW
ncbi:MAG TPA: hypothetical protein VGC26_07900 [Afipia sp.]